MARRSISVLCVAAVLVSVAAGDTTVHLFVSSSSSSGSTGNCSATAPCASLTQAVAVARSSAASSSQQQQSPIITQLVVSIAPGIYLSDCSPFGLQVNFSSSVVLQRWNATLTNNQGSSVVFDCQSQGRLLFLDGVQHVNISGISVRNAAAVSANSSPLLGSGAALLWTCYNQSDGGCSFVMGGCTFENNTADGLVGGGAVALYFPMAVVGPQISVQNSRFEGNSVMGSNGSAQIVYSFYIFEPIQATGVAVFGGAMSVFFNSTVINVNIQFSENAFFNNSVSLSNYSGGLINGAYGGAVSVFYASTAINCSSSSSNSLFSNNIVSNNDSLHIRIVHGGALSVFYLAAASNCSANISTSAFANNTASDSNNDIINLGFIAYGGAVSVHYSSAATSCSASISNSTFTNNAVFSNFTSSVYGGAVSVFYSSVYNSSTASNCSTSIIGNTFVNNFAFGNYACGAVSVYYNGQAINCSTSISSNTFTSNTASNNDSSFSNTAYGGAVSVHYSSAASNCSTSISSNTFSDNTASTNGYSNDGNSNSNNVYGGALSVFYLSTASGCDISISNSLFSNNTASNNNGSNSAYGAAISVFYSSTASNCTISIGNSLFSNNTASGNSNVYGGALSAYYSSTASSCSVRISDSAFDNNTALDSNSSNNDTYGGAVNVFYSSTASNCTIRTSNSAFTNNSASNSNSNNNNNNNNNNSAFGGALSVYYNDTASSCSTSISSTTIFINNTASNSNGSNNSAYGGAISVFYSSTASNCSTSISRNTFTNNAASNNNGSNAYGGALSVFYSSTASDCSTSISNSSLANNTALNNNDNNNNYAYGGAVTVFYTGQSSDCSASINGNSAFTANTAANSPYNPTNFAYGGAVYVFLSAAAWNYTMSVADSQFRKSGAGLSINGVGGAISFRSPDTCSSCAFAISNSHFDSNSVAGGSIQAGTGGAMDLFFGQANATNIVISNTTTFNNSAQSGGFGGAVSIVFQESINSNVFIQGGIYCNNSASGQLYSRGFGGSIALWFLSANSSTMSVSSTYFSGSYANIGSALLMSVGTSVGADSSLPSSSNVSIAVHNCSFLQHTGNLGGALAIVTANENAASQLHFLTALVSNCSFQENNAASGSGAAAYLSFGQLSQSTVRFSSCWFEGNSAVASGGAIAVSAPESNPAAPAVFAWKDSFVIIDSNSFSNNRAQFGAAVTIDTTNLKGIQLRMSKCVFENNIALVSGGACFVDGSPEVSDASIAQLQLSDCQHRNNSALVIGGAVYAQGLSVLNMTAVQFVNNSSPDAAAFYFASAIASNAQLSVANTTFESGILGYQNQSQITVQGATLNISSSTSYAAACAAGSEMVDSIWSSNWSVLCVPCKRGYYQLDHCAGEACQNCNADATCTGATPGFGAPISANAGYWMCKQSRSCSAELFPCPEGFCLDGNRCSDGRENSDDNVLCGRCESGFTRVGTDCKQCQSSKSAGLWIAFVVVSIAWVGFLVFLGGFPGSTAKKKILFYFVQTLRIVLGPSSSWAGWTSAFSLSVTKSFCIGIETVPLLWLQLSTPIMYFAFWFVLLVAHWLHKNFQAQAGPFSSKSSSYRMALMSHLIEEHGDLDAGESTNNDSEQSNKSSLSLQQLCRRFRFLRALEFLLLFSYETLTEQALQLLNCVGVGSCGSVLAEYPDISCPDGASYIPLLVIAVLILTYTMLFPIWLFIFLRRLHRESGSAINKSDEQQPSPDHLIARAKFGVFYDHYKPQFWWWEIQVLARRVLILVVYVAKYRDVAQRTYGILILSALVMVLHVNCQPFNRLSDNILETISLGMLTYAASTKAVFPHGGPETHAMHDLIITVMSILAVAIGGDLAFKHLPSKWLRQLPRRLQPKNVGQLSSN